MVGILSAPPRPNKLEHVWRLLEIPRRDDHRSAGPHPSEQRGPLRRAPVEASQHHELRLAEREPVESGLLDLGMPRAMASPCYRCCARAMPQVLISAQGGMRWCSILPGSSGAGMKSVAGETPHDGHAVLDRGLVAAGPPPEGHARREGQGRQALLGLAPPTVQARLVYEVTEQTNLT